jgi:soluble lytic murein transglycosylase-like protein
MKWISYFILLNVLFFAPFHQAGANKKSVEKNASKPVSKKLAPRLPPLVIPHEYKVFESAKKDSLLPKLNLTQIQNHQRELKNLGWNAVNKTFQREVEDLYWAYEIARAEKLSGVAALNAWIKALSSLNQFKWIYYWTGSTSKALVKICKTSKGTPKEEKCSYLAKKVSEAFPKLAVETQAIKELIPDQTTIESASEKYERMSQTYSEKSEKIEKDEEVFAEILDHYLNRRDSELYKTVKVFLESYPKSILRYRAIFFIAERQFASGDKKEAEPSYQLLVDETPYSYYAIIAAERLGISLKDRISKEPIKTATDFNSLKLSFFEREALSRLQNLVRGKKEDSVAIELEQFSRLSSYPSEFLIYLSQQAYQAKQDLAGFRFATEILQRKKEAPLNHDFIELIFPDRFSKEIADQSKVSQIDPLLVVSLMKQESGFKGGILSSSGAAGLMQLMPFTAIDVQKDLELRQLREPVKNIEIGTKYIAMLLNEKFNGNVVYALAGYNAGPHRVAKWRKDAKPEWTMQEFIEAIPYKETRNYVMTILRNRFWYQYRKGVPQQSVFEAWRSP